MTQAPMRLAVAAMFLLADCSPKATAPPPPPPAAAPAAPPVAAADKYSPQQLEALLAPIALYPDELLTQVLMAATYPLEIVAAHRWWSEGANKSLKGAALEAALKSQSWDPSVKSIVPFPQGLTGDAYMRSLIAQGFLGKLREVHVHGWIVHDFPEGIQQLVLILAGQDAHVERGLGLGGNDIDAIAAVDDGW